MAKSKMNLKYKTKKRERNKNKVEVNEKSELKSFIFTLLGILVFIALVYGGVLGLKALGVFDPGYTAPQKGTTEFSYEKILIGTVFNQSEKEYYVLFDTYGEGTNDQYVDKLVTKSDKKIYKVDMSNKANATHISTKGNEKADKSTELKINGITLIKIKSGKIAKYYEGLDKIEYALK